MTEPLTQLQIDWLLKHGVSPQAMYHPSQLRAAHGNKTKEGFFEPDPDGPAWFTFEEPLDVVFWNPKDGGIAYDTGRAFALGEPLIDDPWSTAIDRWLKIFADPLQWLQHDRRGLVVLNWTMAFDKLRDVPRIAVAEDVLPTYRKMMRPPRMPQLAVLPKAERRAA